MSGQQQGAITKKKPKCRGNRRLQRFKRRCYAKGLDSETIGKLVLKSASSHASTGHMIEEKDQAMTDALNRDKEAASASTSTPVNQVRTSNDELEVRLCLLISSRLVLRASINVSKVTGLQ